MTLLAWLAVAHNSGSGWVQALGAVLGAVLVVGLVGPALVVTRALVTLGSCPADAVAGAPTEVHVRSRLPARVRPVSPAGPVAFIGPRRRGVAPRPDRTGPPAGAALPDIGRAGSGRAGPDEEAVTLVPARRGLHTELVLEVATAAPFGLLWWARTVRLPLEDALHVSPRLGPARPPPARPADDAGTGDARIAAAVGEPRGVRPYRPGDSRRFVHWPASAHRGDVMVREMEGPVAEPVTVRVSLSGETEADERAAEETLGTVVALLDQGVPVVLDTPEPGGRVVGPVADRRRAGRRLARAATADGVDPGTGDDPRGARPGVAAADTGAMNPAAMNTAGERAP